MEAYALSAALAILFAWIASKNRYSKPSQPAPAAQFAQLAQSAQPVQCTQPAQLPPSDGVTGEAARSGLSFRIFAFLSFLPLFLVSSLRYGSSDYLHTYLPEYYNIVSGLKTHYEIGFIWINKFVYAVFHNVDWLFVVTSFMFLLPIFLFIFRRSVNIPLSVFLLIGSGMYYYSFDQIRQYIVIAVFLCSLKYIEEKKLIKYVIIILAASLIHKLALAFLPVYFLCRIRLSRRVFVLIGLIAPAASALFYGAFMLLAGIFYPNYVSINYGFGNTSETMTALTLFVFILTAAYYKKIPQSNYNTILVNLQLIAWVVAVTTRGIPESYRLLALFMYSSIILLPVILNAEKNKYMRFILLSSVCVIYTTSVVKFLISSTNYMFPYRSIFDR